MRKGAWQGSCVSLAIRLTVFSGLAEPSNLKKGMSPAHVVNFTRQSWVISAQQIVMHRQLATWKRKERSRFSDIYALIAVGDIMNEHDFTGAARWLLAQGLPVFPLIQTDEAARNISFDLPACHAGVLTGSAFGIDFWAEDDPCSVFLSDCAAEEDLQAAAAIWRKRRRKSKSWMRWCCRRFCLHAAGSPRHNRFPVPDD